MRVVDAEVKHLRPNTLNVKEFLTNSPISLLLMNFLGGLSIVFCVIAIFYNNINFEVMVYSTSFYYVLLLMKFGLHQNKQTTKKV